MSTLAGACLHWTRRRARRPQLLRSAGRAESLVGEMKEFRADLLAMRQNPSPRGGKRVGNSVWFDLTLSLPLGIALDNSSLGDAVGVTQVLDGGSAAEHNKKFMFEMDSSIAQNWVQQGDRLMMVNGMPCNSKEAAVELISGAKDPSRVRLKFSRERTGFIQVAFPERNFQLPVRPRVLLRRVAEEAGVTFTCTASSCDGSCWHVDDRSQEVYRLCNDVLVGELPSKSQPSGQGTGSFSPFQEVKMQDFVDNDDVAMGFDNTEPLALRPCPELYERAVKRSKR